ncbi:hypothetical protein H9P43_008450 [Blastocladiella emersonii ATCC 22665]|nr:hypothetical protein H9P43_008450 [Blastocladiella emersonii ATCC 22665]
MGPMNVAQISALAADTDSDLSTIPTPSSGHPSDGDEPDDAIQQPQPPSPPTLAPTVSMFDYQSALRPHLPADRDAWLASMVYCPTLPETNDPTVSPAIRALRRQVRARWRAVARQFRVYRPHDLKMAESSGNSCKI